MLERIYLSSLQTGRCNQWTPTEREVVESWNWELVGRVERRKRSILLIVDTPFCNSHLTSHEG